MGRNSTAELTQPLQHRLLMQSGKPAIRGKTVNQRVFSVEWMDQYYWLVDATNRPGRVRLITMAWGERYIKQLSSLTDHRQASPGCRVASEVTERPDHRACLWCGQAFTPRRDGGKRQMFCRSPCRRGFDAAGRRWVTEAIAAGVLTVDALKNGPAAMRALAPALGFPAPGGEAPPQRIAHGASRPQNRNPSQGDLEQLMARAIAMRRCG